MTEVIEHLAALLRRYQGEDGAPTEVQNASLAEALRGGTDPLRIVDYFLGLGLPIRDLDDLLGINADPSEDELHAFRVVEGVAITVVSQGEWALYTP